MSKEKKDRSGIQEWGCDVGMEIEETIAHGGQNVPSGSRMEIPKRPQALSSTSIVTLGLREST